MSQRSLKTFTFGGSTPRRAESLTPVGQATVAIDCNLSDGTLDSWRVPLTVHSVSEGTLDFYQALNCEWLESTRCASWAEGSVDQRHVFASQYNDYEYPVRIVREPGGVLNVLRLGLPCPADRPVATGPFTFSKGSSARQYAYQWIDSLGNASALSEPSEPVLSEEGSPVQVSGWGLPAGDWDIQTVRIARSVSGYESSTKVSENKIDAAWMVVADVPITQVSYVDTLYDADLFDAVGEDDVMPPPAGLKGLSWIRSMNCLAGYVGRTLHFSENNSYHNWAYSIKLDDNVRGMVESNGNLYVATDGAPYFVSGVVDCDNASCRKAVRLPQALPLIGSGHRSMVAIPSGAVYPTHSGLVAMMGNGAPALLTRSHYSAEDWQALHPDTLKVAYHEGRLYCFMRKGAFCLTIKDGAGASAESEHHTELSFRPEEVLVTHQGKLLLRFGQEVKEWNRGREKLPHYYETRFALIGVPFTFGAVQIMMTAGAERLEVYGDEVKVLDETFTQNDHCALPLWATGQDWRWAASGTANVKMVVIAPSTKELG